MLKVTHDGSSKREPSENCCLCHRPTRFWWGKGPANVALCESCAKTAKRTDLPTKEEWFLLEGARAALVKRFLPTGVRLGEELTYHTLLAIVSNAKKDAEARRQGMQYSKTARMFGCSQTMMENELSHLTSLLDSGD